MFEYLIPLLYMSSFSGFTFVLLRSLQSGADAYAGEYTTETARQFEDIFLFIPPRRISQLAYASAMLFFMLGLLITGDFTTLGGIFRGAIVGILLGSLALFTPKMILAILRQRRLLKFNLQLVDALMNMSNALKAGFSIMQAFEAVVKSGINPIAQEFTVMLQQIRLGVRFEDALNNMVARVKSEDLSLVVLSIETAKQTGGNLTEVFDTIAHTIRERMRIERRIQTLTAQGRLQGIIVGMMPIMLAGVLFMWKPEMMVPFFRSIAGILCIIITAFNLLCGALFIRKIIKIDI
jgi:tight adherence protein B